MTITINPPSETLRLVLGSPQLYLGLRLAQLLENLSLLLGLLLDPLPHGVELGGEVLELAHQSCAIPGLSVGQSLCVIELSQWMIRCCRKTEYYTFLIYKCLS